MTEKVAVKVLKFAYAYINIVINDFVFVQSVVAKCIFQLYNESYWLARIIVGLDILFAKIYPK